MGVCVWGGNSVLGKSGNEARERERTPNGQALAQGAKEAKWASLLVGSPAARDTIGVGCNVSVETSSWDMDCHLSDGKGV